MPREKLGDGLEGRLFSVSRPPPQYERGSLRGGGRGTDGLCFRSIPRAGDEGIPRAMYGCLYLFLAIVTLLVTEFEGAFLRQWRGIDAWTEGFPYRWVMHI